MINLALILTILCSVILAFAWKNVAKKIEEGFPAGKLTNVTNLHRPSFQSELSKEVIILIIPNLKNDELPDLPPVSGRIKLRLNSDSLERGRLPGFYRGTVEGPVLEDELFFLLATGYSLRKVHYGPVTFGLNSVKSGPSFLDGAKSQKYYVSLCGTAAFHERFPEDGIRREYIEPQANFNSEASKVLKSSFVSSRGEKSVHFMCLEPSFGAFDSKVASELLSVALARSDETGALVFVMGPQYGNIPGKVVSHDFFFYGKGVVHKQFPVSDSLTIADLVSTLSCQMRVPQPSACLGWPIADLFTLSTGSRRLWLVLQVSQENGQMLPMLVAHRFGRTRYKAPPLSRDSVNTDERESQYLADRNVSTGRSSRDEAVIRNVLKYIPRELSANDALFTEILTILFLAGALFMLFFVLFFGPSWISSFLFCLFFNLWLYICSDFLYVYFPEIPFSVVRGSIFPGELFLLIIPPVLIWSLLGIRYQWNGRESIKAFLIVGAVSLMVNPVFFYLSGGFRVMPPVTDEFLLWSGAAHGRGLLLFLIAMFLIPTLISFISRSIDSRQKCS
jgi:hypothetical protein